mgnify:FL=1
MTATLQTLTWGRESHGLFDYESRSTHEKKLKASGDCKLIRTENEVEIIKDEELRPEAQVLASFTQTSSGYFLAPQEPGSLWLVVKSLQNFVLSEGAIIKLGRVKYRVKELSGSDTSFPSPFEKVPPEQACKFCFCDENTENNPLISPCQCSGSMKFIHLFCLQEWLNSKKLTRNNENSICHYWKSVDCEICKRPFPVNVYYKGEPFDLFSVGTKHQPYLILEAVTPERNNHRGIHVITFINKCVAKLGRGHDSDVRISDISVSRFHATIKYLDGKFILEDNNSKFGTLVQLEESYDLSTCHDLVELQIGRTVISVMGKSNLDESLDMSIEETEDESID